MPITVPTGWGDGRSVKTWTVGGAADAADTTATKQHINAVLLRI
jgi:hypothetical protein